MYRCCLLFSVLLLVGCARTVAPTPENINKIFASQDFTFEFHSISGLSESLSFANDVLVYKSDKPTLRREITYNEVLLINEFIQNIVNLHDDDLEPTSSSYYVVQNTAYTTTIVPRQEDVHYHSLIEILRLKKTK